MSRTGMTITEKIIAAHADREEVCAGDLLFVKVDRALANDVTAPIAIQEFRKTGAEKVFDRDRVVLVPDHFTPNKDIKSAEQVKVLREFAREQELTYFFEQGEVGIEHVLLPEQGIVGAGDVVVGADSHTCTYGALGAFSTGMGSTDLGACFATGKVWIKVPESMKFSVTGPLNKWVSGKDIILHIIGKTGVDGALYKSMEFGGETISGLSMDERFTICNMAIEAGAKNGIIAPDKTTETYLKERPSTPSTTVYRSDPDAVYAEEMQINAADIDLQVAFPHLPENARPVGEAADIRIDQVVIGSCTNGRISDLRTAAGIMKGRKVDRNIRVIVIPGTPEVYKQALKEGLIEIFLNSGAVFSPPTCGPCLGGHMGILASGEKALATTNRNFVGRMGSPESEVYLSGPPVAAASALTGRITHPDEVV